MAALPQKRDAWEHLWACAQADSGTGAETGAGSGEWDQQRQAPQTALAAATSAETWAAASAFLSGLAGAPSRCTADRDVAADFQHVTAVRLLQCQHGLAGDRSQASLMQACTAAEQALLQFQMLQTAQHQLLAQMQGQFSASHVSRESLLRLRHAAAVMLQQAKSSSAAPDGRQSMLLGLEQMADGLAVAAAAVAAQGSGSLAQAADAALLGQAVHLWAQAATPAAQEPRSAAQAATLAASLLCVVGPVARSTTEALVQELLAEDDSSGLLSPEQLQKLFPAAHQAGAGGIQAYMPPEVVSYNLLAASASLHQVVACSTFQVAPCQSLLHQSSCQLYSGLVACRWLPWKAAGSCYPSCKCLRTPPLSPELPSQAWPASQPAPGGLRPVRQGRARWYPIAVAARRSAGCQAALLRVLQSAVREGWSPIEAAEVSGHLTGRDSGFCLVVTASQSGSQGPFSNAGAAPGAGQAGPLGSAAL